MRCTIKTGSGQIFGIDLDHPLRIGIPFESGSSLRCFGAPPLEFEPLVSGEFTGAIEKGSPVNFYNFRINPHGNGTHTECIRHIADLPVFIGEVFEKNHFFASLISVHTEQFRDGDLCISYRQIKEKMEGVPEEVEALIIRSLPNGPEKKSRDYTGTNPPYFSPEALRIVRERGIKHLLTDLPSVDREEDGGKLVAHKAFWDFPEAPRTDASITELIYVDNDIPDGQYMLMLQPLNIKADVSPSSPVLYEIDILK